MFELLVARKYLLPSWRRMSLSLISLLSMIVIGLVVWLILVFFSVTSGLERMWVDKLVVLTGPVRITPTDHYYNSWYHVIDSISSDSDYTPKTFAEKLQSDQTNPWDPDFDQEWPSDLAGPLVDSDGEPRDLIKELFYLIHQQKNVVASTYEVAPATVKIKLERPIPNKDAPFATPLYDLGEANLSQTAYMLSFDEKNSAFNDHILPVRPIDIDNFYKMGGSVAKSSLKPLTAVTPTYGWMLPRALYPKEGSLQILPVLNGKGITHYILTEKGETVTYSSDQLKALKEPLVVPGDVKLSIENQIATLQIQNQTLQGAISLDHLIITNSEQVNIPWIHKSDQNLIDLPSHYSLGDGVLLPRSLQESGVLIGDRGSIHYEGNNVGSNQEKQLPIYVAGFYDPGIMAMGGKFILAPEDLVSMVRSAVGGEAIPDSQGIKLHFNPPERAIKIKKTLDNELQKAGLAPYFQITTYEEFDFTKAFLLELKSQKNLFTLLAIIIIIVACSNIISLLIILVNDKKKEIGILRSMGATTTSIASIFGLMGLSMGICGSLMGLLGALLTLHYLPQVIGLLSHLQGFDAFNRLFYNQNFPNELSMEALQFVFISTCITSVISAIVPAIKACLVKPAATLRSE
ncbi:FtsX-like permease family protein [Chlamydiales bacterium]|nr:FtsX-like permease family protein [Chlamydiales bacterium]